jgi:hypothetical protein
VIDLPGLESSGLCFAVFNTVLSGVEGKRTLLHKTGIDSAAKDYEYTV